MATVDNPELRAPAWLLRPLPVNAKLDQGLLDDIDRLALKLPGSLAKLNSLLQREEIRHTYDAAANRACAHVWNSLPDIMQSPWRERAELGSFALRHFVPTARYRV